MAPDETEGSLTRVRTGINVNTRSMQSCTAINRAPIEAAKVIQRSTKGGQRGTANHVATTVRACTIRIAWVTLASAGGSLLVDAAQASDAFDTTPHKVVSFKDLNLNSPEGVAALYKRIKSAAYDVCGSPYRYDLSQYTSQVCIKDAVSRAIRPNQ